VRARQKLDERDDGGALRDQQADDPFDRVGLGFRDLYLQIGGELSQIGGDLGAELFDIEFELGDYRPWSPSASRNIQRAPSPGLR